MRNARRISFSSGDSGGDSGIIEVCVEFSWGEPWDIEQGSNSSLRIEGWGGLRQPSRCILLGGKIYIHSLQECNT